jgi:hypothetical protein
MGRILVLASLIANGCFAARPVIFDTDMSNDIDDALPLATLPALTDRGECEVIGVIGVPTPFNPHKPTSPF